MGHEGNRGILSLYMEGPFLIALNKGFNAILFYTLIPFEWAQLL